MNDTTAHPKSPLAALATNVNTFITDKTAQKVLPNNILFSYRYLSERLLMVYNKIAKANIE